MTTDDHTCVCWLDDVVLRQVLASRDESDIAMLLRLNLAAAGVGGTITGLLAPTPKASPSGSTAARTDPASASDRTSVPGRAVDVDQCRSQTPTNSTV